MQSHGDGHKLVMRQIDAHRFTINFSSEHVHVKLLEAVVAEVNFSQREAKETVWGETLQVVVTQIQSLQVTQLGQSIRAYLKMQRRGEKE